jgi:hypothetical protein
LHYTALSTKASKVFDEIAKSNREGMAMYGFPFKAGFSSALVAGWVSIPLVFDKATVRVFTLLF